MRFILIGTHKTSDKTFNILCDEDSLRFYALAEEADDEEELEYLYDLMSDKSIQEVIEEKLKPYEITNPNMIEALKCAYRTKKEYDLTQAIKKLGAKAKVERTRKNRRKNISYLLILALFGTGFVGDYANSLAVKHHKEAIEESLTNEKEFENYDAIGWALTDNETISNELREVLFNDFNTLVFSDTPMIENRRNKIIKRLENYDFTNLDKTNYQSALEYILFKDSNILNYCFISSLDECANDLPNSEGTIMFGALTYPFKDEVKNILFVSGEKECIKLLANHYNVTEEEIEEIISLIELYTNSTDEDEKVNIYETYQKRLAELLTTYYKNKEEITQFDRYVLASTIFGGDYIITNNVFNEHIWVTHSSDNYEKYTKYYNRYSGEDESMSIYKRKLESLIEKKGSNLDYNDPDCRFLLYLYNFCFQDTFSDRNKDLLSVSSKEELANLIVSRLFVEDDTSFIYIKKEFIYNYFTSGKICEEDIINLVRRLDRDTLSAALYVDTINCLKKEEYINIQDYLQYIEQELNVLKFEEDLYYQVLNSLQNGESLFSEFSILPQYQDYKDPNIKKYILEQE